MITVVRLAGPLLAWPSPAKYRHRHTEPGPTLSAVQGLLAAAAGVTRGAPRPSWVQDAALAIRLDCPGSVLLDYHTINPADRSRYRWLSSRDRSKVRTVVKASGGDHQDTISTERYYRQDQAVLVFIDDPDSAAYRALQHPTFTVFAGRKACVLSFPFVLGQVAAPLEVALGTVPTMASSERQIEGVLFHAPTMLTKYKEPVLRPERPSGPVGEGYQMQARHSVLVDPPRMASWMDVLESLRPTAPEDKGDSSCG